MEQPLVSIIILIKDENDLKFLDQALNSVEKQIYSNYEINFVLMGAKQKFKKFLSRRTKVSDNVVFNIFELEKVYPVGYATNRGIENSKGKYVVRLDPDDEFDENLLLTSVGILETTICKAVHPDFYTIDKLGEIIDYGSPEVSYETNPLDAGVVFDKESLHYIGSYDEVISRQVSYELHKRFKEKYYIHEVKLPLYKYRKHGGNYSKGTEEILAARRIIDSQGGRVLCVIPARGGSKGILKKNLREINGKSLLQYVAEAAKGSELIDFLIVSTDDTEIGELCDFLDVSRHYRPDCLATDEISIISVAKFHLNEFLILGDKISAVVCLQPTSPLVLSSDIDEALKKFFSSGCDSVVSVYKVSHNHPFRVMKRVKDRMFPFSDSYDERVFDRRDLPPCYAYNGAFFIRKPELLLHWNEKDFGLGKDVRGHVMPEERSINIDSLHDLRLAELLLNEQRNKRELEDE
jgi:CMP-N-acetylneuraminic acid synthetase